MSYFYKKNMSDSICTAKEAFLTMREVGNGMALYVKCIKRSSNIVAATSGCFLCPGQCVLVTATLSHVSVGMFFNLTFSFH